MKTLLRTARPYDAHLIKYGLCLLIAAVCMGYYLHLSLQHNVFRLHLQFIIEMSQGERFVMHFGSFFLTILMKRLTDWSWIMSFSVVLSLHVVLSYLAMALFMERFCKDVIGSRMRYLLALGLLLLGPLGLPMLKPEIYDFTEYTRYLLLLRNSSYTAAQPYVILAFIYIGSVLTGTHNRRYNIMMAATTLWLSAVMKPSFAIAVIPSLLAVLLLRYPLRAALALFLKIAGPVCLMLPLQYYVGFVFNPIGHHNSFVLDPWAVWKANNVVPLLNLLLKTVFPLAILILRARHLGVMTLLAWMTLGTALIPFILFRETSVNGDRNFEWGVWFALSCLFMASLREWLVWRKNEDKTWNELTVMLIASTGMLFNLHVVFGVVRFLRSFNQGS